MDGRRLSALRTRKSAGEFTGKPAEFCRALWEITGPAHFADSSMYRSAPDVCGYGNEHPDSLAGLFQALLPSFAGYDWRADLARLTMRRLVILGAQDAFPLEGGREWVPLGSNAQLIVIEGASHFPFIEQASPFFSAVESFLEGGWPAGTSGAQILPREPVAAHAMERTREPVTPGSFGTDPPRKPAVLRNGSRAVSGHRRRL
jgi:hypothetical protein